MLGSELQGEEKCLNGQEKRRWEGKRGEERGELLGGKEDHHSELRMHNSFSS